MILNILFLFSISFVTVSAVRARYENYHVYKITPITKVQINLLIQFEELSDSIIFLHKFHKINESLLGVVAPHKVPDFLESLKQNEVSVELVDKNFQAHLDEESHYSIAEKHSAYNWNQYFDLDSTYEFLKQTAEKYPEVELIQAGKTYEGREILGVKVSFKEGNPGIVLEAGIHAREWIAPATATFILNELLVSDDPVIGEIAENYDWYIFPHLNPDGYVYTHSKDRMWRKTRSINGICYGADPNRNFNLAWNTVGTKPFPCSNTYAGKYPESEIEVKTFTTYLKSIKDHIDLYISFHSFSQLLLFPNGYKSEVPSNYNDLKNIGDVAVAALAKRYNSKYSVGDTYHTIYPASGTSIDWVYNVLNVPLTYCYELRPLRGSTSLRFLLSASEIIPTGEETLDSIIAMIKKAEKLNYFI